MKGRVLIIAGSDSSGGAGIQADIKTVTMLGGYAAAAVTALTAQDTLGVHAIHEVPEAFIAQQIKLVLDDIGADAIKIGMLHKASVVEAVADALLPYPNIPLILDPVMSAKGGTSLLQADALTALIKHLISRALLLTPNIPEAEALLENERMGTSGKQEIKTLEEMHNAANTLLTFGSQAVLLKGGHLEGETVTDILTGTRQLFPNSPFLAFSSSRIPTRHTHGTGCTLASAIATGIAQGMTLPEAVKRARVYVAEAIRTAPGFGKGHGPLNHLLVVAQEHNATPP